MIFGKGDVDHDHYIRIVSNFVENGVLLMKHGNIVGDEVDFS